jgi:hypothetical protein
LNLNSLAVLWFVSVSANLKGKEVLQSATGQRGN